MKDGMNETYTKLLSALNPVTRPSNDPDMPKEEVEM